MWERNMGCLSYPPQPGRELQPRHVPWPVIEPVTFHLARGHPTDQSLVFIFNFLLFFFILTGRHFSHCFYRERKGERKTSKHRCEREASICCLPHLPRPGTEPAIRACAPTRNRTKTPRPHDNALTSQVALVQGQRCLLIELRNSRGWVRRRIASSAFLLWLQASENSEWPWPW